MKKFKCMECGEMVFPNQKHTHEDCEIYKGNLRLVELSRLQIKIKKKFGDKLT